MRVFVSATRAKQEQVVSPKRILVPSLLSTMANSHSNGYANGTNPSLAQSNNASMTVTRKKLAGYVGFANLPNQVHRKSVRKGFQFTAMVVGLSLFTSGFPFWPHPIHRRVGSGQVHSHQHPLQYSALPPQGALASPCRTPQDGCHREHWRG